MSQADQDCNTPPQPEDTSPNSPTYHAKTHQQGEAALGRALRSSRAQETFRVRMAVSATTQFAAYNAVRSEDAAERIHELALAWGIAMELVEAEQLVEAYRQAVKEDPSVGTYDPYHAQNNGGLTQCS